MGASLTSPTSGQRIRRGFRWIALLGAALVVMWYDDWDLTNIAAAFVGGVLLAEDVWRAWRRLR